MGQRKFGSLQEKNRQYPYRDHENEKKRVIGKTTSRANCVRN